MAQSLARPRCSIIQSRFGVGSLGFTIEKEPARKLLRWKMVALYWDIIKYIHPVGQTTTNHKTLILISKKPIYISKKCY